MQVTLVVCNVCQDRNKSTRPYTLQNEEKKSRLDLCDADAKPIEKLLALETAVPSSGRGSGRGRQRRVTSIEEIEASKGAKRAG